MRACPTVCALHFPKPAMPRLSALRLDAHPRDTFPEGPGNLGLEFGGGAGTLALPLHTL